MDGTTLSRRQLVAAAAGVLIAGCDGDRRRSRVSSTEPLPGTSPGSTTVLTETDGTPGAATTAGDPAPTSTAPPTAAGTTSPVTSAAAQTSPPPDAVTGTAIGYLPPADGERAWATASPAEAGLTDDGVATLQSLIGARNSTAWLLLHDGRIVAEHYWGGTDSATTRDVASCQKSVVSTMTGIARAKGLLDLDQPVSDQLGPGWTNAQADDESAITMLHLLTMTSGLDERSLTVADPPGTRWAYNTDAYQKLRLVLEAVTGTPIDDLSRAWILDTIGASAAARWEPRPNAGVDAVGEPRWGLELTVRDMGRFGLLAMHRGEWGTTRLAPVEWFDEAWTSIPQRRDYGYLWWLFGRGRYRRFGAPDDMVAALGAQDQKIYVIPSAKVVMARQGDAADRISETESDFDVELVEALRGIAAT